MTFYKLNRSLKKTAMCVTPFCSCNRSKVGVREEVGYRDDVAPKIRVLNEYYGDIYTFAL